MNIWTHVRLAGAAIILLAFFIHRLDLTVIGLTVQYVGVMGGLSRVEQLVESLLKKIDPEDEDAVR